MDRTELTQLINLMGAGDDAARVEVLERLYDSMLEIARRVVWRGGRAGQTQTIELAHEAMLKVAELKRSWNDRKHFLATFARAVQTARVDAHRASQRAGDVLAALGAEQAQRIWSEDGLAVDVLELAEALELLHAESPLAAEVVRLRFFAQATHPQVAVDLGIPEIKARRTWERAKQRLQHLLEADGHDE